MKTLSVLLLVFVFCSCETPDTSPTEIKADTNETISEISTSEVDVDFNSKSTSSLSFSRSRRDKIEEIWKEILEQNEDLNKDITSISRKLETLNEEIQAIEFQISNHNDYFSTIEAKAKGGVKDTLLREPLLASIEKSKFDLKSKLDLLKERKLAAVNIREEFQEHLNILKFSSVNSLVHRYFNEELGDGSELFKQTEVVREAVNNFTKRHPATY